VEEVVQGAMKLRKELEKLKDQLAASEVCFSYGFPHNPLTLPRQASHAQS
jgi:hypothetical protein